MPVAVYATNFLFHLLWLPLFFKYERPDWALIEKNPASQHRHDRDESDMLGSDRVFATTALQDIVRPPRNVPPSVSAIVKISVEISVA